MANVGDLVRGREALCVAGNTTAMEAARILAEHKVGALCVCEGERLVGVLSERDLVARVMAKGRSPRTVRVEDVMTSEVIVATAEESVETCLERMRQAGVRHLPVVQDRKLVSMISIRDLLAQEVDQKDFEVKMMTSYVYSAAPAAD